MRIITSILSPFNTQASFVGELVGTGVGSEVVGPVVVDCPDVGSDVVGVAVVGA